MITATQVSTECFGGVLQSDSYGFHTSLEFFALFAGCARTYEHGLPDVVLHESIKPELVSHDYARRIAWPCADSPADTDDCFDNEMAPERRRALSDLLKSLAVPVPGRRKESTWQNSHFLPYSSDLIHWDARLNRGKITLERIYYRGAGALAFRILRADQNKDRRSRTEQQLQKLLQESSRSLREFLNLMNAQDTIHKTGDAAAVDELESEVKIRDDDYEEILRDRTALVLSHADKVPGTTLVNALMYVLPLGVLRLQYGRASELCAEDPSPMMGIVDCGFRSGQLRRESKRSLSSAVQIIDRSLEIAAETLESGAGQNKKNRKQFVSYFTRTAGAIGLLNALVGVRYFSLSDSLLEAIVLSETDQGGEVEIPFKEFCRRMNTHWGLVIDRESAAERKLLSRIDGAVFEDNAEYLSRRMRQLGFLHEYSDQTRMVRYGF